MDRSALNQELTKIIAYIAVDDFNMARFWARELVERLITLGALTKEDLINLAK